MDLCDLYGMKLSQYARRQGIRYRTALRWWIAGHIKGYQAPTGTIISEDQTKASAKIVRRVAISARVSSREQQVTLERQAERLQDECAAYGYQIATVVKEMASGVTAARPRFLALLRDPTMTTMVVEHKDHATHFGFRYVEALLELSDRGCEVGSPGREQSRGSACRSSTASCPAFWLDGLGNGEPNGRPRRLYISYKQKTSKGSTDEGQTC